MCVLVVEDEPLVRAVAVEALEAEGFEVIEAPSADYAVTLLRSRDGIDVVFTDVAMPGTLDGVDLTRLVRMTYPHTNVLVCSGALPPGFSGEARFVRKPYRVAEIAPIIRGNDAGVSLSAA
jgi:CheY-like chemotaxis protein